MFKEKYKKFLQSGFFCLFPSSGLKRSIPWNIETFKGGVFLIFSSSVSSVSENKISYLGVPFPQKYKKFPFPEIWGIF